MLAPPLTPENYPRIAQCSSAGMEQHSPAFGPALCPLYARLAADTHDMDSLLQLRLLEFDRGYKMYRYGLILRDSATKFRGDLHK